MGAVHVRSDWPDSTSVSAGRPSWPVRRLFPLLATAVLLAVGMVSTTSWGAEVVGKRPWQLPNDIWGTLLAARRILHLQLSGIYTPPTGLISLPGAALVLVPVVAMIDALGLGWGPSSATDLHPGGWLLAGPYEIVLSCLALFAADALAERMGVSLPKRFLLAAGSGVALWNVSVRWGHPEDAVAVALLLFGVVSLADGRTGRSGWLVGVSVCVQPLVLLAIPVLLVVIERRRLAGYLVRAATPSALLLAVAATANWRATETAVTRQPNWPTIDHTTPWTSLAPHLQGGGVATGPARAITVVLALGCALVARRRRVVPPGRTPWNGAQIEEVLWWLAVALALRCVFEPVMVAFYLWPPLAAVLVSASRRWARLLATAVGAGVVTGLSQVSWHGPWTWWSVATGGVLVTLAAARLPWRRRSVADGSALALPTTVG